MKSRARPTGITTLSLFFLFGAVMRGLAALMLVFPNSILDPLWKVNPSAQQGFAAMGRWAILLMAIVCGACAIASRGLWCVTRIGYWTAAIILAANLLGDSVNVLALHDRRTLIGLPIGAAMLCYLVRKRKVFQS